jgi:hypothetical protein
MKQIIISFPEDQEDKQAVINAVKNSIKLSQMYDDVFRKHIKYESDKADAFEIVWEELSEYLEDN